MKLEDCICGRCAFHRKTNEEWVCSNEDSDNYALEIEYGDTCDDFEER